jgi:DnaJ-class molecular chaperone
MPGTKMTKEEAAAELEIDLTANTSADDIKKAYKKAALKWCGLPPRKPC